MGGRNVTIARAMACGFLLLLGFAVPIMADEAPGAELRLAEALAAEGQWALALAECRRAELAAPESPTADRARQLAVTARQQLAGTTNNHARLRWSSLPVLASRLLVGFYRRQVGPAIGSRCELHPSCSAYLLEACRAHGILGFALLGDRLFREPAVSGARERMITLPDGRRKVADPLSDHDFWMEKQP